MPNPDTFNFDREAQADAFIKGVRSINVRGYERLDAWNVKVYYHEPLRLKPDLERSELYTIAVAHGFTTPLEMIDALLAENIQLKTDPTIALLQKYPQPCT